MNKAQYIRESLVSFSIASLVVFLWWLTAYFSLFVLPSAEALSIFAVAIIVVGRTFLHTGLFILAHDAMHDSLVPTCRWLNSWSGRLILGLYGFLSFDEMKRLHHQHHCTPAQSTDPDYYSGGFFRWYFSFMRRYTLKGQGSTIFLGMSLIFYPLIFLGNVPVSNAVLFWLLPQGLSSLQLFYFGTYRPHRRPTGGYKTAHRAVSSRVVPLLSFFSCYHFDYHWEHHEYPHLPWYKLPSVHGIDAAVSREN